MNQLDELVNYLESISDDPEDENNDPNQTGLYDGFTAEEILGYRSEGEDEENEKKPRKYTPEYFIIMDDLSNEIRHPSVGHLLKRNRHFRSKVIISSQYLHDLPPGSIQQLDYILLWPGIPHKTTGPENKLKKIHNSLDLSISYPLFEKLYDNATEEKYNFLYVDIRNEKYRHNFNKAYRVAV